MTETDGMNELVWCIIIVGKYILFSYLNYDNSQARDNFTLVQFIDLLEQGGTLCMY